MRAITLQLQTNGPLKVDPARYLVDKSASACYSDDMTIHEDCICQDGCSTARCYTAFNCWDCNINTLDINEYYMVTDELWELATIYAANDNHCSTDVMLCIGCLEARIGGKLTTGDFPELPINRGFYPMSARLLSRVA